MVPQCLCELNAKVAESAAAAGDDEPVSGGEVTPLDGGVDCCAGTHERGLYNPTPVRGLSGEGVKRGGRVRYLRRRRWEGWGR